MATTQAFKRSTSNNTTFTSTNTPSISKSQSMDFQQIRHENEHQNFFRIEMNNFSTRLNKVNKNKRKQNIIVDRKSSLSGINLRKNSIKILHQADKNEKLLKFSPIDAHSSLMSHEMAMVSKECNSRKTSKNGPPSRAVGNYTLRFDLEKMNRERQRKT